jgi:FMN phosphatase YigB (HAD superfamily)
MFDLGDTLVTGKTVIAEVPEALEAISSLSPPGGHVEMGLISDFTMPPNPDEQSIGRLFDEYCEIVRSFGLETYFAPLEKRATISTQAGVSKPDKHLFDLALTRLGIPSATLQDCIYVTETRKHLIACQGFGMGVLLYQPSGPDAELPWFKNWSEAPAKVEELVTG